MYKLPKISLGSSFRASTDTSQSPLLTLEYVHTLTDGTGMIQHGIGGVPDPQTGYTTDDNCRALLAMTRIWRTDLLLHADAETLLRTYARFMLLAQIRDGENAGWFINFFSYNRNPLEARGTEDCLGRCIWALGECASGNLPTAVSLAVRGMLLAARPNLAKVGSPHAMAYALLGLCRLPDAASDPQVRHCADFLARCWREYSKPDWQWFEPQMTYDNARCVEAMLRVAVVTGDKEYMQIATSALDFLTENSFDKVRGCLSPVGNCTWYVRGGDKCNFDQQTIEAGAYAELYCLAAQVLGQPEYAKLASRCRNWFLGDNVHRLPIYDPETGGCFDALTAEGVNLNQGAESVLSYILAETACAGGSA